jgi:hypothetical protein
MPQATKQEQLRALLRPLSEQFTSQVASTIMNFVQQSVRDEVELVLGRALPAAEASPAPVPAPKALPPRKAAAKTKAPTIMCSKQRCDGAWYRPSGSETKLCYKHFLEAGGKAPPGKKAKKK